MAPKPNQLEVSRAAEIIRAGGLVAFPTETVYGLGANALDAEAVARIFAAKRRPRFDPLIVHVAHPDDIARLATVTHEKAAVLMDRFWPGPLTLVLPKSELVPDIVTAGLATVALRMPDHPIALSLIEQAGTPIAAPSANRFGRTSPTTAGHVADQLGDEIELIFDGGPCAVGLESTIVSLVDEGPRLLRHGGAAQEDIEAVLGRIDARHDAAVQTPSAPGMLSRHYATRTPMRHLDRFQPGPDSRAGLLSFAGERDDGRFERVEVLSRNSDLCVAAAALFAAMRRLDAAGLDLILVERFPAHGLGRAINERLDKACAASEY